MRAIPDINGQRTCRKCNRTMPVREFSEKPCRFVCKLCHSRMFRKKSEIKQLRTWEQQMMAQVQWDARAVFRVPHNIRVGQIKDIPCTVEDVSSARIVPRDCRTGIAPYNSVVVDSVTAKCLHLCFVSNRMDMYTQILGLSYPDAHKPIEIMGLF